MAHLDNPAIPQGSTVLVTGVNGFIGSHVANQFLQSGFKVRGTVRDAEKSAWVLNLFRNNYGKDAFELAVVKDMNDESAYDEHIKGVSAVVHVASVMSFDPNPNNVIPATVNAAIYALKAAINEPSVKRFVYTSSSAAVEPVNRAKFLGKRIIHEDSWSEDAVDVAWAPPPYTPERSAVVYFASKVQAEQAVWNLFEESKSKRPDLVVNAVLPYTNFGKSLDLVNQGHPSTSGYVVDLFEGNEIVEGFQVPVYYVDVEDDARLHVAAAIFDDVRSQRIFAFAGKSNLDDILEFLRRRYPGHKLRENYNISQLQTEAPPREKAEKLLKRMGRPGWTSLEDTLAMNAEDLRASA
ncbi:hypothetical protein ACHAQA_004956 [Verticillium albo-atrum]